MLTEYHTHEMATATERTLRNALKFGQSGKVNSKEGVEFAEGLLVPSPNYIEVRVSQEKDAWERLSSDSLFFSGYERS